MSTVCDLETRRLRKEKSIPVGDGVSVCTSSREKACACVCICALRMHACVLKEEKQQTEREREKWEAFLKSPITNMEEVTFDFWQTSTSLVKKSHF